MEIAIRPITSEDFDVWLELRHALWPWEGLSALRADLPQLIDNARTLNLLAWAEGKAVGLLEVAIRAQAPGSAGEPVPYLEGWYVAPAYRRMKVGGELVRHAEAWARERGYTALASDTITVYPDSPAAHAALGFNTISTSIEPEDGYTWHFYKAI